MYTFLYAIRRQTTEKFEKLKYNLLKINCLFFGGKILRQSKMSNKDMDRLFLESNCSSSIVMKIVASEDHVRQILESTKMVLPRPKIEIKKISASKIQQSQTV